MKTNIVDNFRTDTGGMFYGEHGMYLICILNEDNSTIPYFHVIDANTKGKKVHCKLEIKTAKYYGSSKKRLCQEDVLALCKHLDYSGWINSKGTHINNWKILCTNWNMWNSIKVKTKVRPEFEKLMFKG